MRKIHITPSGPKICIADATKERARGCRYNDHYDNWDSAGRAYEKQLSEENETVSTVSSPSPRTKPETKQVKKISKTRAKRRSRVKTGEAACPGGWSDLAGIESMRFGKTKDANPVLFKILVSEYLLENFSEEDLQDPERMVAVDMTAKGPEFSFNSHGKAYDLRRDLGKIVESARRCGYRPRGSIKVLGEEPGDNFEYEIRGEQVIAFCG